MLIIVIWDCTSDWSGLCKPNGLPWKFPLRTTITEQWQGPICTRAKWDEQGTGKQARGRARLTYYKQQGKINSRGLMVRVSSGARPHKSMKPLRRWADELWVTLLHRLTNTTTEQVIFGWAHLSWPVAVGHTKVALLSKVHAASTRAAAVAAAVQGEAPHVPSQGWAFPHFLLLEVLLPLCILGRGRRNRNRRGRTVRIQWFYAECPCDRPAYSFSTSGAKWTGERLRMIVCTSFPFAQSGTK